MKNKKLVYEFIIVVVLSIVFITVILICNSAYEKQTLVDLNITVPEGYYIEDVSESIYKTTNWHIYEIDIEKPSYSCSDYEKKNEPWKCYKETKEQKSATVWYNKKSGVIYQESGTFDIFTGEIKNVE